MSIVTDGVRSDKWRPFVRQKLAQIRSMGITAKNILISGYRISLLSMDDIQKARIVAPPGAVVVDFTGGQSAYRYADQYGGDFVLTDSHVPSEGSTPNALFSGLDDVMYHGTSDYFSTRGAYGTLAASWYAPRAVFGGDPATPGSGYLAGSLEQSDTTPGTTPTIGYAFTRAGTLYSLAAVAPSSTRSFDTAGIGAVRAGRSYTVSLSLADDFPGFRGKAHFIRPVWGEKAAVVYAVHNTGACSGVLGAAHILAYRHTTSDIVFDSAGTTLIGQVTQGTLAAALGLPAPCTGDGGESQLTNAMTNLVGLDWPFSFAPYKRGVFSYGVSSVCFWGPVPPIGAVRGVVFSADGTAVVQDIVFPPHDSDTHQPVISEVSPGFYVCEIRDPLTFDTQAVYYGSPFDAWTELVHPAGVIIKHRAIKADVNGTRALALVYASGSTVLYEYSSPVGWTRRGKVADHKIDFADVAIFGDHEYARLSSEDSPVRGLWA